MWPEQKLTSHTMAFAHLPSTVFFTLISASNPAPGAIAFLVLRSCTQSMDTAPCSAFLAGIVHPSERTAMTGFVNIAWPSVSSSSPLIVGFFAGKEMLWVAFVTACSLLVLYDWECLEYLSGIRSSKMRMSLMKKHQRKLDRERKTNQLPGLRRYRKIGGYK